MEELKIQYNGQNYTLKYNSQSGYYEIELKAPELGGIYPIDITYTDLIGTNYADNLKVQILTKPKVELVQEKVFMWIFHGQIFQ